VRVSKFRVRQFRNLQNVEVSPSRILNILVGDNGQGKTSFIEALYYLSTLQSFRTNKTSDLIQKNQGGFLLEAEVSGKSNLNTDLSLRIESKTRKAFINHKPVTGAKFTAQLRAVVFSPESLSSIKAGPESRRALIDQATYQLSERSSYAQRAYTKALRQRNACLRQVKSAELTPAIGEDILSSLEGAFLETGAEVTEERLCFLDQIFPKIDHILEKITGVGDRLKFTYRSGQEPWIEREKHQILYRLRSELNSSDRRKAERTAGITLTGPHRHDISFLFNENDSRIFCSQGQQRAVILAFKIAEIVYHSEVFGSFPLLLLDDVLSEFDEHKRRYLLEFLKNNEAQTFLTTTDQTHLLEESRVFQVEAGRVNLK